MLQWTWTRLTVAAGALAASEPNPLDFTWKGFVLAAVNFLILVLVLYRLLHKPILEMLARRQKAIDDAHEAAEQKARQAEEVHGEYRKRIDAIQEERDHVLADARQAAEEARHEIVRKARAQAEREVAGLQRDWERRHREALRGLRDEIVGVSLDLARRTLVQLVDDDVESRLRAHARERLQELADSSDRRARKSLFAAGGTVRIISAAPLADDDRRALGDLVQALTEETAELSFEDDPDLIAGVRVEFSSQAIDATLADVLDAVRERIEELAPEDRAAEEPEAAS
ncbi:MAG: hypothetical protein GXY85_03465 [Candidatus Brocadiaceae bacterium]|nr:hypothetical protein [Candidatus Brocadiaceae bacterium]